MKVFPVLLTVGGFVFADDADAHKGKPIRFKITTRKKDDTVAVQANKEKTVFVVKSPSGISQVVIERLDESWPEAVVLRLHLKTLASFGATNGKVKVDAAVSSQDGKPKVYISQDADKDENFWMEIRMVGGDGKPAKEIPLKDGYFEIVPSRAFFEGNPKSISLSWIDCFRR